MKVINKKRGITLVETIVAILIVAIVSVMAISISAYSIRVENKNLRDFEIASISNVIVDSFDFSSDQAEFESIITNSNVQLVKTGDYTVSYEFTNDFTTVQITAKDSSGAVIFSLTHNRRG